jgi:uncharacterized membrane protein
MTRRAAESLGIGPRVWECRASYSCASKPQQSFFGCNRRAAECAWTLGIADVSEHTLVVVAAILMPTWIGFFAGRSSHSE